VSESFGFDLSFPAQSLKAALVVSFLSVWVLVGLFHYLNHYTKRGYFQIWTAAWLFYALWLTLCIALENKPGSELMQMFKQWCVGISAVFLLWGSARFLGQRTPQMLFGLFLSFLLAWSYVGIYHLDSALAAQVPIFALIGVASVVTAFCFVRLRQQQKYIGSGLLAGGFALWGVYLTAYPFLQQTQFFSVATYFISAVLQLFIAVSMIILVLEEVRQTNQTAIQEVRTERSQRRALQTKVTSTEERYRSLFDQASEGIVITAMGDLHILELNQTARRLLGINAADAGQQSLDAFCRMAPSPNDAGGENKGEDWFKAVCAQRQLNLERKDGEKIPVEVDGAPIQFEGRPAYQFFIREHTERVRLEQQLRQAEKLSALGQMISGVAHELNNPLAVIKGYLELILAKHQLPPQTRTDLEKVAQEGNRAAKLVSNFLSFAREQPAHRETVDLNELARRVVELRKFDLRLANVVVNLELDSHVPSISADPDQVHQVLANLVHNAVQAMMEAPLPHRLLLRTELVGKLVRVFVEDSGPGVPDELVARIFEPFFTTKEVGNGTGLGLSIAHSIMTDHKGRIYYQRASFGGASFALEFPLEDPAVGHLHAASASLDGPARLARTASPAKILVLDDEKAIAELLGELLEALGHRSTICNSPLVALTLIEQEEFDVIISDFRMPQMDGQQFFTAAVEKKPELAHRFIFLTGDVVSEDTLGFLRASENIYLAKPFHLAKVEEALAAVLLAGKTPEAAKEPAL
jgi:PAS domain S-box-containing protein